MTRYQKITLLIGTLIFAALVAIIAVLVLQRTPTCCTATPTSTVDQQLAVTKTAGAREALLATATWVVEQNYLVETQLVVSATDQQERINATVTARAGR